ncbi:MAG: hypothetical protein KDK99_14135 [Verrucomicrobiales bacterium]|nr:hypothetical protein [Verrucomicrobiales bacterium]
MIEKLSANTEAMSRNLEVLALQNDLEKLDRDWNLAYPPDSPGSETTGVVGSVVAGLAAMILGFNFPSGIGIFLVGFGLLILVAAVLQMSRNAEFRGVRNRYFDQRQMLARKIERMRAGEGTGERTRVAPKRAADAKVGMKA